MSDKNTQDTKTNPWVFISRVADEVIADSWQDTEALEIPSVGCLVLVTTRIGAVITTCIAFVPEVKIGYDKKGVPYLTQGATMLLKR